VGLKHKTEMLIAKLCQFLSLESKYILTANLKLAIGLMISSIQCAQDVEECCFSRTRWAGDCYDFLGFYL
jgi:hypothetical protein